MATVKRTTKKAATKRTAKLEKIGHFNITVYKNDTASVDVDCPTNDILATLASIIASDEGPGQLMRRALDVAAMGLLQEKKTKKKKATAKKKAAPKKK
jgi:hypothetical protein